jgi:hypothetical protein
MALTACIGGHYLWLQSRQGNHTLCHCGTGNAGDGSKHLADATATLVASRPINVAAMMKRFREWNVGDAVEVYSDQCCLTVSCRLHEAGINPSSDELAFARAISISITQDVAYHDHQIKCQIHIG